MAAATGVPVPYKARVGSKDVKRNRRAKDNGCPIPGGEGTKMSLGPEMHKG